MAGKADRLLLQQILFLLYGIFECLGLHFLHPVVMEDGVEFASQSMCADRHVFIMCMRRLSGLWVPAESGTLGDSHRWRAPGVVYRLK